MGRYERKLAELLDMGLSQLQAGEIVPSRFPSSEQQVSEELAALIQIAVHAQQTLQPPAPDERFVEQTERRLLKEMRAKPRGQSPQARQKPGMRLRTIPVFLTLLLVFGFLTATLGVVNASAASLPGDRLYPIKIGLEDVRLTLSLSPEGDVALLSQFSDERVREVDALTDAGRFTDLEPAIEQYLSTLDQLLTVKGQIQSSGETEAVEAVEVIISQQIETLLRVQDQVPTQARLAIQAVIERSQASDKVEQAEGQEKEQRQVERQATQATREQQREQEKDLRTAEQLAGKYDVPVDQVIGLFHGTCQEDWKCVREWYRELKK